MNQSSGQLPYDEAEQIAQIEAVIASAAWLLDEARETAGCLFFRPESPAHTAHMAIAIVRPMLDLALGDLAQLMGGSVRARRSQWYKRLSSKCPRRHVARSAAVWRV